MTRTDRWNREWAAREVWDDIKMEDYFGGRQYVVKYFPWWGRGLEGGCGLGRYVFYLSSIGRDIAGLDSSEESIQKASGFASRNGYAAGMFSLGDLCHLPFKDDVFSYYISLGVLEHFREGPGQVLAEAKRVLAPGGLLLVTAPNRGSLEVLRGNAKVALESALRVGGERTRRMASHDPDGSFFQYWYFRREVCELVEEAGFKVVHRDFVDIRFPLCQRSSVSAVARWLLTKTRLLDLWENGPFRFLCGNSVVIALKPGDAIRCFFCGRRGWMSELLKRPVHVPVCSGCRVEFADVVRLYRGRARARYTGSLREPPSVRCAGCGSPVQMHPLFGRFGFDRPICLGCLHDSRMRGEMVANHVVLRWKPYA